MYHQVKLWVVLNLTICTTLWSTSQFLISIHFNFSKSPVSVSINNLSDRSSKNFILWDLCRWCHIWEWIFYEVALDSLYTTCKYFLPLRQKLLKALQKEGIIILFHWSQWMYWIMNQWNNASILKSFEKFLSQW